MARLNCVTILAPAKLNLALDVVGLLPGGYHDLDMTMQAITLYERVVLRRSPYLNLRLPGSLVPPITKTLPSRLRWPFLTTPAFWRAWTSQSIKIPRCGRAWRAAVPMLPLFWWA